MSLLTLPTVQKLQTALHAKAKGEPKYRFYALYDKVYRHDVLWDAWRRCRINGGAPGVDEQTFEDIEAYGVEKWLKELAEEGFCEPSVSDCGSPHPHSASPVVGSEAQVVGTGNLSLSPAVCLRPTGTRRAPGATSQPSACESMILCP